MLFRSNVPFLYPVLISSTSPTKNPSFYRSFPFSSPPSECPSNAPSEFPSERLISPVSFSSTPTFYITEMPTTTPKFASTLNPNSSPTIVPTPTTAIDPTFLSSFIFSEVLSKKPSVLPTFTTYPPRHQSLRTSMTYFNGIPIQSSTTPLISAPSSSPTTFSPTYSTSSAVPTAYPFPSAVGFSTITPSSYPTHNTMGVISYVQNVFLDGLTNDCLSFSNVSVEVFLLSVSQVQIGRAHV